MKSICDNVFDLQRSSKLVQKCWYHSHNNRKWLKSLKVISRSNSSQKPLFFAVLIYFLYSHPRYFKLKQKYQQYGPCFQNIFPFLMNMSTLIDFLIWQKVTTGARVRLNYVVKYAISQGLLQVKKWHYSWHWKRSCLQMLKYSLNFEYAHARRTFFT